MEVIVMKKGSYHETKIEPYFRNIIIYVQNSDTWKIQLTIAINFISQKDADEERIMHSSSNNIKCTSYNDVNEVLDELFETLHRRCFWFSSADVLQMS